MSKHRIILSVPDELLDRVLKKLENVFGLKLANSNQGEKLFLIDKVKQSGKVHYTKEQASEVIERYQEFVSRKDNGEKIHWFHTKEAERLGLTKYQLVKILKESGLYRFDIHNKNKF